MKAGTAHANKSTDCATAYSRDLRERSDWTLRDKPRSDRIFFNTQSIDVTRRVGSAWTEPRRRQSTPDHKASGEIRPAGCALLPRPRTRQTAGAARTAAI